MPAARRLLDVVPSAQGHYALRSGFHTDRLYGVEDCFFAGHEGSPRTPSEAGEQWLLLLAERLEPYDLTAIVGLSHCGMVMAKRLARALEVKFNLAVHDPFDRWPQEWKLAAREIGPGDRVAIVDDIILTGNGVRSVSEQLADAGARVVVVAAALALGQRGLEYPRAHDIALELLDTEPVGLWAADECPLCAARTPIDKRRIPGEDVDLPTPSATIGVKLKPGFDKQLDRELGDAPRAKQWKSITESPERALEADLRDVKEADKPFTPIIEALGIIGEGMHDALNNPESDPDSMDIVALALLESLVTKLDEFDRQEPLAAIPRVFGTLAPNLTAYICSTAYRQRARSALGFRPASRISRSKLIFAVDDVPEWEPYVADELPELGDFPYDVVVTLAKGDWDTEGILRVCRDVPASDLDGADILHDARRLLRQFRDSPAIELRALARAESGPDWLADLRLGAETLGQGKEVESTTPRFWLYHLLHLFVVAGWLTLRNETLWITDKGRAAEARGESQIYADLFLAHFRDSSHDHFDFSGLTEPTLWNALPMVLFLLRLNGAEWTTCRELVDSAWPLGLRSIHFPHADERELHARLPPFQFQSRVLRPLTAFGLMEWRGGDSTPRIELEYRPTPLFERFLQFDVE